MPALVRIGAIVAAFALFATALGSAPGPAAACQEVHPKTGDLNADGSTDSIDAQLVLTFSAGMMAAPDKSWYGGADVNCDTTVNAIDASLILQAHAGLYEIRP
jgi:hypothetical protein